MISNDRKTIAAILMSRGIKGSDLAVAVDVTPETVSRWRRDVNFMAAVNQLRMELVEVSRERLRSKTEAAVEIISEIMENAKSDAIRLKAATEIIRLSNIHDPRCFAFGLRYGEEVPESEWRDLGV